MDQPTPRASRSSSTRKAKVQVVDYKEVDDTEMMEYTAGVTNYLESIGLVFDQDGAFNNYGYGFSLRLAAETSIQPQAFIDKFNARFEKETIEWYDIIKQGKDQILVLGPVSEGAF